MILCASRGGRIDNFRRGLNGDSLWEAVEMVRHGADQRHDALTCCRRDGVEFEAALGGVSTQLFEPIAVRSRIKFSRDDNHRFFR